MKKQSGFTVVELIIGLSAIFGTIICLAGYVINVVKLVNSTFDPITTMVVARAVGTVFPPLGIVLGYM